jgi:arylsulfatase
MREEEPENEHDAPDLVLPNGETFPERFGPRAVIHSRARADRMEEIEDATLRVSLLEHLRCYPDE